MVIPDLVTPLILHPLYAGQNGQTSPTRGLRHLIPPSWVTWQQKAPAQCMLLDNASGQLRPKTLTGQGLMRQTSRSTIGQQKANDLPPRCGTQPLGTLAGRGNLPLRPCVKKRSVKCLSAV